MSGSAAGLSVAPGSPFVWMESNVDAGLIVCRRHTLRIPWTPCGWKAKWTHKIGFVPGDGKDDKSFGQYCQIAMTDGLVYHRGLTKAQLAERLTRDDMIPMPRVWWREMCDYLADMVTPDPANDPAQTPRPERVKPL